LEQDWPTTVDDPVAAADDLFSALDGRFELSLEPGDVSCDAIDCPGPQDGWDQWLPGNLDVRGYGATVATTPMDAYRSLWIEKQVTTGELPAAGYGTRIDYFRRRLDGSLVVLTERQYQSGVAGSDVAEIGFASDATGLRLSIWYGSDVIARLAYDQLGDRLVVITHEMMFRAPRTTPHSTPTDAPPPLDQLQADVPEGELLPLLDEAEQIWPSLDGPPATALVTRSLSLLDSSSEPVRLWAIDFTERSFGLTDLPFLIAWEWWAATLLLDPSPDVRKRAAEALRDTTQGLETYHCIVQEAVGRCQLEETAPEVLAICTEMALFDFDIEGACPAGAPQKD
jgi:hypothetical protein